MKRMEQFRSRARQHVKQITEPILNHPLVELTGDRRVLIENHIAVTEYGLFQICIAVRFGEIRVCGECLHMEHMTKDRLLITGNIDQICLCRR